MSLLKWFSLKKAPHYIVRQFPDVPDEDNEKTIYLIGEIENEWLILFKCPCGCKDKIFLNTIREVYPSWQLTTSKKGLPSIYPSIRRIVNCRSHFCLKKGRIVWVRQNQQFF
jgi:hypothetical protein